MKAIAVRVIADDPQTRDATVARLRQCPQFHLVTGDADAVLVVTDEVSAFTLRAMMTATARHRALRPGVVVVCNRIGRQEMLHAARLGLVTILSRSTADLDRLAEALVQAATRPARHGPQSWPRVSHGPASPHDGTRSAGPPDASLTAREIQVLGLLADGLDTSAIAARLQYSQRTVKYIIHGVVTREQLRNRAHAVAFALRQGVL